MIRRSIFFYSVFFVIVLFVMLFMGTPFTVRLLVEAAAFALIALGLNVQWGYGGLFNFGVLGFVMVGGFAVTAMAMPTNPDFWQSDGPWMLGRAILTAGAGALLIIGAYRLNRLGWPAFIRRTAQVLAWIIAYVAFRTQIDPAVVYIEREAGWVGGLDLPVWIGWAFGGLLASGLGLLVAKVCLGLRQDYLAIATIGIAEIVRALIKNMEWLTRGTLTVSPVPWPVPTPQLVQEWDVSIPDSFIVARGLYLLLVLLVLIAAILVMQRAYRGPWGRMMRAIRDNYVAAEAIGKDVGARQLQLFVLGSAFIGIGGAILTSFAQIFDPSAYQPINHTFLIWVMVIVGGAGNNLGAVLGGGLIYVIWVVSEPIGQSLFTGLSELAVQIGWAPIPDINSRSVQMRVLVMGFVIVLALRFAPRGLLPELLQTRMEPSPERGIDREEGNDRGSPRI